MMGIARSTYYDKPAISIDDTALVETIWVTRHLPGVRFARYADDAVLHCTSRRQAE